jgi:hypothetical protein
MSLSDKMKSILIVATLFLFIKLSGQDTKAEFDGKKWNSPYTLNIPPGWDVERFLIPILFAPSIPYKGVEDIRFTPGWAKIETNEYWSYAFLWYIDNTPTFDSKIIEKNLIAYYTGLINSNIDKSKMDSSGLTPVKASIEKRTTDKGDLNTFEGTVSMIDYMKLKPIIMNVVVHVKSCKGQNKTFIFHELSPKPFNDPVWNSLDQLWVNFACSKE